MATMSRDELRRRQEHWMQQRRAEKDREEALADAGVTSFDPAGDGMERMLDSLTARITERLQVEVRKENAQLMQSGDVGKQVERFLEKHIANNTCPICYELMAGKFRQPMLLFPCGHTFCADCLSKHMQAQKAPTCPFCREPIVSQAPNVSLQQMIDGFIERQAKLAAGEVLDEVLQGQEAMSAAARRCQQVGTHNVGAAGLSSSPACSDEAERHASQYRAFSMRCSVLENQLLELRQQKHEASERHCTMQLVLSHLRDEEAAAKDKLKAAQAELEVISSQVAEQAAKCEEIEGRAAHISGQVALVEKTLKSLQVERDKSQLLSRHFSGADSAL
eukprot:6173474-Pleurochrysis_carterae.AAC.1